MKQVSHPDIKTGMNKTLSNWNEQKFKLWTNFLYEHRHKNIFASKIQGHIRKIIHHNYDG